MRSMKLPMVKYITGILFIDRPIYLCLALFSYDVDILTTLTYTHRHDSQAFAYDGKHVINLKCWLSLGCVCVVGCSTLNLFVCHVFKSGGFHSTCYFVFGLMVR